MNLAQILKLLHITAAFWLVAGVLGRTVVLSKAGHSTDISTVRALLPVATVFERGMVIPGTNAVFIAGLLTAWAQGWPILGLLQQEKVTPELKSAFRDPVVRAAHNYELVVLTVIVILMVLKPF